jgi:hypothetical protein
MGHQITRLLVSHPMSHQDCGTDSQAGPCFRIVFLRATSNGVSEVLLRIPFPRAGPGSYKPPCNGHLATRVIPQGAVM